MRVKVFFLHQKIKNLGMRIMMMMPEGLLGDYKNAIYF
jgi:hypothetical protein